MRAHLLLLLLATLGCRGQTDPVDVDEDGWVEDVDCDDLDAAVHPEADELCDGQDNDCDDEVDEADATDAPTWYLDDDEDGFGDPEVSQVACTPPSGYVDNADDCDDGTALASPLGIEVCDGLDNDCAGGTDVGAADAPTWYLDDDEDGFGDPEVTQVACEKPSGYVDNDEDCDDLASGSYPGGVEVCGGADEDCDGEVDEDDASDASTWYVDYDGDGWGSDALSTTACLEPDGFEDDTDDCDDSTALAYPGGVEVCDGLDNDCDEEVDEDDATDVATWYLDFDEDGYGDPESTDVDCDQPSGYVANADDCDDSTALASPLGIEVCDDLDNDCIGGVDVGAVDAPTWYEDHDTDGYGNPDVTEVACDQPDGYVDNGSDCDDRSDGSYPGGVEVCGGADEDCDGEVDEDDASDASTWYVDYDGDGWGSDALSTTACLEPDGFEDDTDDCDDTSAAAYPGGVEVCDGLDNDCDEEVDEDDATDVATWYLDFDEDGYGDPESTDVDCDQPSGYVANADDCDDSTALASPLGIEVCDDLDNDCIGGVDVGAADAPTWYEDHDTDGYGNPDVTEVACDQPDGYVDNDDDCDDLAEATYPGGVEVCGGGDEDCDGIVDEDDASDAATWYVDADGDGWGSDALSTTACVEPTGFEDDDDDCDDTSAAAYPGGVEVCDELDNDCDRTVDVDAVDAPTWYEDHDTDGYGNPDVFAVACEPPDGYVANDDDCEDDDDTLSPETTWYIDHDEDGYGSDDYVLSQCVQPDGYLADDSDCHDDDDTAYPGSHAPEVPGDGVDVDCDGIDGCTDFNCDGWPDVVVVNYRSSGGYSVDSYVYLGTPEGLAAGTRIDLPGTGAHGADVVDIDRDGFLDVLLVEYQSSTSTIYWGTEDGPDPADSTSIASVGSEDASIVDLDDDGYYEIVFANYWSGTYVLDSYVHWGSADGWLAEDRTDLPTLGPWYHTIADIDADGYLDLVFPGYGSNSDPFHDSTVYWGSDAGYSVDDRTDLPTIGATMPRVADFDRDGFDDLLFANRTSASTDLPDSYIYWGSESGLSTDDRAELPAMGPMDVEVADLDGDDYPELIFPNFANWTEYSCDSYIYWGSEGRYSVDDRTDLPTDGARDVVVRDFDHDGHLDVVFVNEKDERSAYDVGSVVYWGSDDGYDPTDSTELPTIGAIDGNAADLDLDGTDDLVICEYRSNEGYGLACQVFYGSTTDWTAPVTETLDALGPRMTVIVPDQIGTLDPR